MSLIRSLNDLPKQVQKHLRESQKEPGERLQLAARTGYRVNSDMPYAWLVLTTRRVVLCSTHRSRGIHANLAYGEISSIRAQIKGIEILPKDLGCADLAVPLPDESDEDVQEIVKIANGS
jgi:hypothetical protein